MPDCVLWAMCWARNHHFWPHTLTDMSIAMNFVCCRHSPISRKRKVAERADNAIGIFCAIVKCWLFCVWVCVYFCVCMLTIERKWQINLVFVCANENENELRNAMSSGRTALCQCLHWQKQELIIYYRFFRFIYVFLLQFFKRHFDAF